MGPFMIVVVCIAVIAIVVIVSKKSTGITNRNVSIQRSTNQDQVRTDSATLVRCNVDGLWDEDGTSGYYENGNIYCCSKSGNYQIGTYIKDKDGSITVKNKDGYVIGRVSGGHITLSREGQLAHFKDIGFPRSAPQIFLDCAELFDNCICDRTPDMNCVALCNGTPESAATFICLHYDGYGLINNSTFRQFWYSWL